MDASEETEDLAGEMAEDMPEDMPEDIDIVANYSSLLVNDVYLAPLSSPQPSHFSHDSPQSPLTLPSVPSLGLVDAPSPAHRQQHQQAMASLPPSMMSIPPTARRGVGETAGAPPAIMSSSVWSHANDGAKSIRVTTFPTTLLDAIEAAGAKNEPVPLPPPHGILVNFPVGSVSERRTVRTTDTTADAEAVAAAAVQKRKEPGKKDMAALHCVMCGRGGDEAGVVIPVQNKQVCAECDTGVWLFKEEGTYFKWCKGCKRFHSILAFKERLKSMRSSGRNTKLPSKCDPCRARGRAGYQDKKGTGEGNGPHVKKAKRAAPRPDEGLFSSPLENRRFDPYMPHGSLGLYGGYGFGPDTYGLVDTSVHDSDAAVAAAQAAADAAAATAAASALAAAQAAQAAQAAGAAAGRQMAHQHASPYALPTGYLRPGLLHTQSYHQGFSRDMGVDMGVGSLPPDVAVDGHNIANLQSI